MAHVDIKRFNNITRKWYYFSSAFIFYIIKIACLTPHRPAIWKFQIKQLTVQTFGPPEQYSDFTLKVDYGKTLQRAWFHALKVVTVLVEKAFSGFIITFTMKAATFRFTKNICRGCFHTDNSETQYSFAYSWYRSKIWLCQYWGNWLKVREACSVSAVRLFFFAYVKKFTGPHSYFWPSLMLKV